jgi:hypothetical protein
VGQCALSTAGSTCTIIVQWLLLYTCTAVCCPPLCTTAASQDALGRPAAGCAAPRGRRLALSYGSLSKVLAALQVRTPPGRVPWRDSALTRWLQQPLQSASEVVLLGTVSEAREVRVLLVPADG